MAVKRLQIALLSIAILVAAIVLVRTFWPIIGNGAPNPRVYESAPSVQRDTTNNTIEDEVAGESSVGGGERLDVDGTDPIP